MRIASFLLVITSAAGWTVENPGWPGVNADNGYVLGIFPNLAYMAFPILPYELFTFLPPIYLYFLLKPTAKVTIPRIIVAVTYFGGIFGGALLCTLFMYTALGLAAVAVLGRDVDPSCNLNWSDYRRSKARRAFAPPRRPSCAPQPRARVTRAATRVRATRRGASGATRRDLPNVAGARPRGLALY